jgi:hypothetical protein
MLFLFFLRGFSVLANPFSKAKEYAFPDDVMKPLFPEYSFVCLRLASKFGGFSIRTGSQAPTYVVAF